MNSLAKLFTELIVIAVSIGSSSVLRAQAFPPQRTGKNILVVTQDAAPIIGNRNGKSVELARKPKGEELAFLHKAGAHYVVVFNGEKALIAVSEVTVKEWAIVPGWTKEENARLNELEELLFLSDGARQDHDYKGLIPIVSRIRVLSAEFLGEKHPTTVNYISNVGFCYMQVGQYDKAIQEYSKAIEVYRTIEANPASLPLALGNLAHALGEAGDYAGASKAYGEAIAIAEQKLPPKDPTIAILLNNFALLQQDNGFHDEAYESYMRSMDIVKELYGTDSDSFATLIGNLGLVAMSRGDYQDARAKLEDSLLLTKKIFGDDHVRVGIALMNLAELLSQLQDEPTAVTTNAQACDIFLKKLGTKDPTTLQALSNMGKMTARLGDAGLANKYYQLVYDGSLELYGPDHPQTIDIQSERAVWKASSGKQEEAIDEVEKLLARIESKVGTNHPTTENVRHDLERIYCAAQQYDKAAEVTRASIRSLSERLGPGHHSVADARSTLARLYGKSGQFDEALEESTRAQAIHSGFVTRVLPHLSEIEQLRFLASHHLMFDTALSAALSVDDQQQVAARIATWVLNGKARSLETLAVQNQVLRGADDEQTLNLARELSVVRRSLAELAVHEEVSFERQSSEPAKQRLAARETELVRALNRENVNLDWSLTSVSLKELLEKIPASGVAIEIVRYSPINFDSAFADNARLAPRYVAVVMSRDGSIDVVNLGDAGQIDALLDNVRINLDANVALLMRGEDRKAEATLKPHLRKLAQRLYDPLAEWVRNKQQIIISLDGPLWLLPWENLLIDNDTYAVERHVFRYVGTLRYLVNRHPYHKPASPPALFADPDYDFLPPREQLLARKQRIHPLIALLESPHLERLPASRLEALVAAPILEKLYAQKPQLFLDQKATESALKQTRSPSLLYLSTHGYFSAPKNDKPAGFGIASAGSNYVASEGNPLLRCGICLTGCNQIGVIRSLGVDIDDGIVTGTEVLGMDLRGTELVILSACETSLGDVRHGEGVAGLRQAFHLAGARAVIGTSWSVLDRESAVLMLTFFKNLAESSDKALALRSAQVEMIENLRKEKQSAHPLYWGAFSISYH